MSPQMAIKKHAVSIKKFSELSNVADDTLRFDAEHYQEKYELINKAIMKKPNCNLGALLAIPVITGHTPSMQIEKFYGGDLGFIKTNNLRENKIIEAYTDLLTEEGNAEIKNSILEAGDVIVTIIGATFEVVGRSALVRESHLPANINQNIALIRVDKSKIQPSFLSVYLNTKYGRGSLHHHSRQTEQVNLNCREVERVLVPLFSVIQERVAELMEKAAAATKKATEMYSEAEKFLLSASGLSNLSLTKKPTNILSFAVSFGSTGRLDAEHYQPKYEDIERAVKSHLAGFSRISDEYDLVKETFQRRLHSYNYIEIGDIDVSDGSAAICQVEVENLPANAKQAVSKGDLLISKVRPDSGAVAIIDFEATDLVVSGAFTVLRPKISSIFSNEILKVFLRTETYGEWMLKYNVGTQYPVVKDEDIMNLLIPKIGKVVQKKVVALVKKSRVLKVESNRLVGIAMRAVEVAIEQDEAAGVAFISENI